MNDNDTPTRLPTTRCGYGRALARLEAARARYLAVCASNEEAAGSGDSSVWHDNFAYEENQRQMHQLAARIHELSSVLARLQIVEPSPRPERATVGCRVELIDVETDARRTVILGGWDDSDPTVGRAAINSPLGRALASAQVGELRLCPQGGAVREYEVAAIEAAEEREL